MRLRHPGLWLVAVLAAMAAPGASAGNAPRGFRVEILVDGRPVREYASGAERYVEARKGKEYAIRLHNPLSVRVAVALSVDGLNTIDARHTSPREARKWVLNPHETVTISGWQTTMREARRFVFTTEDRSYAERLGQPENIGVVSARFFRERVAQFIPLPIGANEAAPRGGKMEKGGQGPEKGGQKRDDLAAPSTASGEYAATGIGDRTRHLVRRIFLELEEVPAASLDIRYEYREQLVRLGILPEGGGDETLARRERAKGFAGGFCPDIE